jgi:plastocyanin
MRGAAIRLGLVAAASTAVLTVPWAGPAGAGGGCHAGRTKGQGATVEMVKACFTPSILRVDPGAEVTFVNKDPVTHNVTASDWGLFDDMDQGDSFSARFAEPGIYPYACTYHPGMTGAVVVGDGVAAGSGTDVAVGSASEPKAAVDGATDETAAGSSTPVGWIGGGIAALAIGVALGSLGRRRGILGR